MENIVVADKSTSRISSNTWGNLQLQRPGVVQMPVSPDQVASVNRVGQNLEVTLKSGEHVTVGNFFDAANGVRSDMVFQGNDGVLWEAQYSAQTFTGFSFEEISSLDTLLAGAGVVASATPEWAIAGLGVLGAGGAAAATKAASNSGGGGGSSNGGSTSSGAGSLAAPFGLALSSDGLSVSGLGEAGAMVSVRGASGILLGNATVGADGHFTVPLSAAQLNGGTLLVGQTDTAGNVSPDASLVVPDVTAPDAPSQLILTSDGTQLSGHAEAGSTVQVRGADNTLLGTTVAAADGTFSLTLSSAQTAGQTLAVTATDSAGNVSPSTPLVAPEAVNTPGPDAPTQVVVSGNGTLLSGHGQAGATAMVTDTQGNIIASGAVGSDGLFSVALTPAQSSGQTLEVTLVDVAGNVSPNVAVTAPNLDQPAPPSELVVSTSGLILHGHALAGVRVLVRNTSGLVIGAARVAADGTFSVTLDPAQLNGQPLDVVATDAAGNSSAPALVSSTDTVPPNAVTDLVVGSGGVAVSGHGEPGDTATVRAADGTVLGSAVVNASGVFVAPLNGAAVPGTQLQVTQADAAGNLSPVATVSVPAVPGPAAPTNLSLDASGTLLAGSAPAGSLVEVRDANGTLLGSAVVDVNGHFSVALSSAQLNGELLEVVAVDGSGAESVPVALLAADVTAPAPATDLSINPNGLLLSGRGEVGATVTVTDAQGHVLGSGVVAATGSFGVAITPAQIDGQSLQVVLSDASGNVSNPVTIVAADLNGELLPTGLHLDASSTLLAGVSEAGATVSVRDSNGNLLGSTVVAANGTFTVTLSAPQANGQTLQVNALDATGSATVSFTGADVQAPAAATGLGIDASGDGLTGHGEVGATVTVRDATGLVIGTGAVAADGTFSVTFSQAQTDAQLLQVVLTDAAGNPSAPATINAPDLQAPDPVTHLAVSANGTQVTGNGEAGATVTISSAQGVLGTATVAANGHFEVTLSSPQINGQTLAAIQQDAAGNPSSSASVVAGDIQAPAAPSGLVLSSDGLTLAGAGEPLATVTVHSAGGAVLGTAVVDSNGTFTITLSSAQLDGQHLLVNQADLAGNVSPTATLDAPDLTPPAAPTALTVTSDGATVHGQGEAGDTVNVHAADGTLLGSAVVASNGSFAVSLTPAQLNGQPLSVNQVDPGHLSSPTAGVTAPDVTPPAPATALVVDSSGATLSGSAEAGAHVQVTDASGAVIGGAPVAGDGSFSVALNPPLLNGQVLQVVVIDAANNVSQPATVDAPDTTPPAAVINLLINPDGASVAGDGEPGSLVTVRNASGIAIGSAAVSADGSFVVPLSPAAQTGDTLSVTASDAAGNTSPSVSLNGPDGSEVAAPSALAVSTDGFTLTGTGTPGTNVAVTNSTGTVLGTAVVGSTGTFRVVMHVAQLNAQALHVTATGSSGKASISSTVTATDTTAPNAPAATINGSGTAVSGHGEVGATVTVRDASGVVLGSALVASNGNYTVALSTAQGNAQVLSVSQADAAANTSPAVSVVAPDLQAPDAPGALAINAVGTVVSGHGEVGASVSVRDASGNLLATGTVDQNGNFQVTLPNAQLTGAPLQVQLADAANNLSPSVSLLTPDHTPPAAVAAVSISANATTLTGTGEAGATVSVRDTAGNLLGNATVAADGHFSVALSPAPNNGQLLDITQADPSGNVSPTVTLVAPDITPPAVPTNVVVNGDGLTVVGQGEPGATVLVRSSDGTVLGTGLVASNGAFSVSLASAQSNGQLLAVNQQDPSGNQSIAVSVVSPDTQAPASPDSLALNAAGLQLSGHAEAGSAITVSSAQGNVLGTVTVAANGVFQLTLSTAQLNGEVLSVTARDAAGNVSTPAVYDAADVTAPAPASNLAVSASGATLSGFGEAGAIVSVSSPGGVVLGTATVASNGSFSLGLAPAASPGEALTVVQTDAAGNASVAASVIAPGNLAPAAPDSLVLGTDGLTLSGNAAVGSLVSVRGADGSLLGTARAGSDGSFSATLSSAQLNGELLAATATSTDGLNSLPTQLSAADITAPAAVTVSAFSSDGLTVTGRGEAGATVTVLGQGGVIVGRAVVASDGHFNLSLAGAQVAGQILNISQQDAAGNESPSINVTAPDHVAPDAPSSLLLSGQGAVLGGLGEAGAIVKVSNAAGVLLGTGTVRVDGTFQVDIAPAQANGQVLAVTLTDAAGNVSLPATYTAPDTTAPLALSSLAIAADGETISGRGEAGATVTVTLAGSVLGSAVVGATGAFSLVLGSPLLNAQVLSLTQTDGAGNISPAASLVTPDLTAPDPLANVLISSAGTQVTGTGEVGDTVTVRDASGSVLGTALVLGNGTFTITLSPAQINNQTLALQQADPSGNLSTAVTVIAPDLTPPNAPTNLHISADGVQVSGSGEVGAAVRVSLGDGTEVGTGSVAANGTFLITLSPPENNGQALFVVLTDAALNASAAGTLVAPDTTPPSAIADAHIDSTGSLVTGTAEVGARVTVSNATGDVLGTAVAGANGAFSVNLITAQQNGEVLTVLQQDTVGNPSPTATLVAPDFTAPNAPQVTALSSDGLDLSGTAEAGARVEVRSATLGVLGTVTAASDGTFTVHLSSAQLNGEVLQVRQTDAAQNTSAPLTYQVADVTAPALATHLSLGQNGLVVSGNGEAGATVVVNSAAGTLLGSAVVASNGSFSVTLSSAQLNGEHLAVIQTDLAGNSTTAQALIASDITAPLAPVITRLTSAGTLLAGTAEAGSTVTVHGADGSLLGSGLADANGAYQITLNPAQYNGQLLSLVATDAAGNVSPALAYTAPDGTAPGPVTALTISADYSHLAGRGEVGATVTVHAGAAVLGTAVVGANGTFSVTLLPVPAAQQVLTVVQADASVNVSTDASLTVPITPAPPAPFGLTLSTDGSLLAGSALAGSTVRVYGPDGSSLGTAVAAANGTFSVTLSAAQTNGQVLEITASTAQGGESVPSPLVAGDTTAPAPLTNLLIDGNGLIVTGRGEAGATVTLRASDGSSLGTSVVAANGTFSVALSSAQANGQLLSAVQTDAASNSSAPVTLTAPDVTAPLAPTALVLGAGGTHLSGGGEVGAGVEVRNAAGTVLATGTVASDGTFAVTLPSAQLNGQTLTVVLRDAAGNVSTPSALIALDTTAPSVPTALALSSTGLLLTGAGEAGARVTVTDSSGHSLGTAVVGASGFFSVTLSAAQLNGQLLSVQLADAAGNLSIPATLTAADITPPVAPVNLVVAADGSNVSGSGEAGTLAGVYDASGNLLGSATVASNGQFSVSLATAQADGQALSVRLVDAAGNTSAATGITAPDITPPAAPVGALINASGSAVSGTGVAGAHIFVRNSAGVLLGSATVAANGTYTVTLNPAQVDTQLLAVTQGDAAGNISSAISLTAPDLTPPAAASALVVAANGLTLTGSGEAGATVTVKSATGVTLGTGTVASNGTFTVALGTALLHGETLVVRLTDASGNVSPASNVIAPDIDANLPLLASNDLVTAAVTLSPVTTSKVYADSFSTVLSGFVKAFTFTVGSGTRVDPTLTLTTNSAVALLNGAAYALQVKDATGNWVTLNTGANASLLQVVLLTGGHGLQVNIGDLLGGDYRVLVTSTGIGVLTTVSTSLQLGITSLTQFSGLAGAAVTGNVITDIGTNGSADSTGPDHLAVLQVLKNGSYITATTGTSIQGLYGTLTINAQGNYSYTANGTPSSVGKVDVFNYELVHPNGLIASASLYVRIDSPQSVDVWSSNLAANALVVDATPDIATTGISLANLETTTTTNLGSFTTLLSGGSGTYSFSVAANTVSDLTLTVASSSVLTLLGSLTLGLYKLDTSTGLYTLVKSWGGSSLLSLGGTTYGVTVDDQTAGTYQVRAVLGGLGLIASVSVGLINAATSTNQFVVSSYTPVSGNLLTDTAGGGVDVLGSALTVLSVLAAGTYVTPGYNGTVLTGTYGSLLVKADGSYTYTLNSGLTNAVVGHTDVFTYQLTHPNGTSDTSTLTIDLNAAGSSVAAVAHVAALGVVHESNLLAVHTTDASALVIHGTAGNDTLDGSHGGAITLSGGAGNDTLIIVDQKFASVEGGTGTDTLLWAGGDASIDLGNLAARVHNIEVIDLNSTSSVNLTLSFSDLLAVTETGHDTLMIKGNAQDSVHMTGTWAQTGSELADGIGYIQYTPQEDPTHHLWVQNGIHVV